MKTTSLRFFLVAVCAVLFFGHTFAVSPSEEIIQRLKDEGRFDGYMKSMAEARAKGVDSPGAIGLSTHKDALSGQSTFHVLVILMDYPGKPYTDGWVAGTPGDFDTLLFSQGVNPTGSMTEFYYENSYGNFVMEGRVVGWYRTAESYNYYTNFCDGTRGMGPYPNNSQRLVEEAVDAADPDVDFSLYDNDGDGYVDGVFVVHAGTGFEESGSDCDIHSHKWSISPRLKDGVYISTFSVEPEESAGNQGLIPIGVFCHEFGHVLGLPDLYDTDYSSRGAGRWALMASGSYNGHSQTPSHFIAWSKMKLGWLIPVAPAANLTDVEIPAIEWNPVAYRLWKNGVSGPEYFMVENRQPFGFDAELPGSGLLIWHIDDNLYGNTNDWHPRVMLEQADGRFDLQNSYNSGDGGDAFPDGGNYLHFHDKTNPGSRAYSLASTEVAVWNISSSDSLMTVDLDVSWSRPYLYLTGYEFDDAGGGNGNGVLESGETIALTLTIANDWKAVSSVEMGLTIDDPGLTVIDGAVWLGPIGTGGSVSNIADPMIFEIPADYTPRIDSFFLEIVTDGGAYTSLLAIEQNVGTVAILLVDDDNNDGIEQYYSSPLYSRRLPYDIRDVALSGAPGGSELGKYETVIWFVGDYRANPLSSPGIAAIKDYLDAGGKLFLSGQGIAQQLSVVDPAFLNDYLKSSYLSSGLIPVVQAHSSSPTFDGITEDIAIYGSSGAINQTAPDQIAAAKGGVPELIYGGSTDLAAVSYSGSYSLMFFSFGMEGILSGNSRFVERDTIFNRVLTFLDVAIAPDYPGIASVEVFPGDPMHLIEHVPTVTWAYADPGGAPQAAYHVQVGTDNYWATAEMWDHGPVTGSDTMATYAGAPLVDGMLYYVRVRVSNGLQWSNWQLMQFRMNSTPTVPSGLTPNEFAGVTSASPDFQHENATDGEGDELTYGYEVYADSLLTIPVAQVDGQAEGSGSSKWTVPFPLNEDSVYYWRVRAFDGFEYGAWSESASFWLNADNQPPSGFNLLSPADSLFLTNMRPEFVWSSSGDGDRFDTVQYVLIVSTDADFTGADTVSGLADTSYLAGDSLTFGAAYYWKAAAYDRFGGITESGSAFMLTTWLPGDASGDSRIDIGDAVFLVNFIFKGGSPPEPLRVGDINADCEVNIGDAVFLVSYIFRQGPAPMIGCE